MEMIKKVHGPTTTLAGIARRGVFVRPGRCSCLQVSKKKTKTGTTFLTACSLYHLHIIALATSHSVFRSPYNTVEGKFKGGQASSVFILKLFSYNSRLERIPSVIRKSDLRLTPVPRDLCAPKKPWLISLLPNHHKFQFKKLNSVQISGAEAPI